MQVELVWKFNDLFPTKGSLENEVQQEAAEFEMGLLVLCMRSRLQVPKRA